MQISSRTRSIALGTAVGVSVALSASALAVAVGDDGGHPGDRHAQPAFASQQAGGRGDQIQGGPGAQQSAPSGQQDYGSQQPAPAGPPMQSGAS